MTNRNKLSRIEKIAGAGALLGLWMVTLSHSEIVKNTGAIINGISVLTYGYKAGYLARPKRTESYKN